MNNINTNNNEPYLSVAKLILVAVVSTAVTLAGVFVLFLPAAYGIDPTRLGAQWGIHKAGGALPQHEGVIAKPVGSSQQPNPTVSASNYGLAPQANTSPDEQKAVFNLTIPAKQSQQLAFSMKRDYELDYHWATDGKPLYCELRGQPLDKGGNPKVFGKLKQSKGQGFFIAPFNGSYALFWENKADQPVTIRLSAKGVFKVLG